MTYCPFLRPRSCKWPDHFQMRSQWVNDNSKAIPRYFALYRCDAHTRFKLVTGQHSAKSIFQPTTAPYSSSSNEKSSTIMSSRGRYTQKPCSNHTAVS